MGSTIGFPRGTTPPLRIAIPTISSATASRSARCKVSARPGHERGDRLAGAAPDKSRPFFLYVCFHEPHEPIDSPEEYVKRYPQATQPGEALYYANITHLDFQVGRLLATLDRLGARQNTLVFLTSDNGPETLNRYPAAWRSHGSPGPLRGMKSWLYEGGFREPGILRWPGKIAAGRNVRRARSGASTCCRPLRLPACRCPTTG